MKGKGQTKDIMGLYQLAGKLSRGVAEGIRYTFFGPHPETIFSELRDFVKDEQQDSTSSDCLQAWPSFHPFKVTLQECQRLLVDINRMRTKEKSTFRFLFYGITQHGKSTLCNGLLSAYDGRKDVEDVFQSGSGCTSFTRGFCVYSLDDNLWLIDMGGIFESSEIDVENIKKILEGRVPYDEELGENLERLDTKSDYPEPESNDLACVVIVMKPNTVITEQLRNKLQAVDDCAARGRITRRLVVTHIEEIDAQFKDPRNLLNIEDSPRIDECRQKLSKETGIPLTSITFVRNYWNRRKTDVYTNYILLKFLKQLMQSGIDAKRRAASRNELRNRQRE